METEKKNITLDEYNTMLHIIDVAIENKKKMRVELMEEIDRLLYTKLDINKMMEFKKNEKEPDKQPERKSKRN